MAYPNTYILLVGDPGIKKSTAMKLAQKIVSEFPRIPIAPASITKEAICQFMGSEDSPALKAFQYKGKPEKYSQLSVFANELVTLLNAGGNPIGMTDFLTEMWDRNVYGDSTKNKGSHEIYHPYLCILGCITTSTIRALKAQNIIGGGLIRRCLFIHADVGGEATPFPLLTKEQEDAYKECIIHAKALQENTAVGEFAWSNEAKALYEKWYVINHRRITTEASESIKLFLQSAGELVIKLSMLLAKSEDPTALVHDATTIQTAIDLVKSAENGGQILFEASGRNELSGISLAISKLIDSSEEPVMMKTIFQTFWKDAKPAECEEIINFLAAQGRCVKAEFIINKLPIIYIFKDKSSFDNYKAKLEARRGQTGQ